MSSPYGYAHNLLARGGDHWVGEEPEVQCRRQSAAGGGGIPARRGGFAGRALTRARRECSPEAPGRASPSGRGKIVALNLDSTAQRPSAGLLEPSAVGGLPHAERILLVSDCFLLK
jgi:hypothetical protein